MHGESLKPAFSEFFLVGELDSESLRSFARKLDRLRDAGERHIAVNLRDLTFVTSSALGYFIRIKKELEAVGGEVVLIGVKGRLASRLHLLGLDEFFRILPDSSPLGTVTRMT